MKVKEVQLLLTNTQIHIPTYIHIYALKLHHNMCMRYKAEK